MFRYLGVLFVVCFQSFSAFAEDDLEEYYEPMAVLYCTDKVICRDKKEIYFGDFIKAIKGVYGVTKVYWDPFRGDFTKVEERPKEWRKVRIPKESHIRLKTYGGSSSSITYREYKNGKYSSKIEFICRGWPLDRPKNSPYEVVCGRLEYIKGVIEGEFNYLLEGKDVVYDWLQRNLPEDRRSVDKFGKVVSCGEGNSYACFEE